MALIVATRRAFSTRMTKASRAEVQKLVLLMAVAAYAFWEIQRGDSQEEERKRKRKSSSVHYLIEIVEALLQTPQAADTSLQQTASAGVLLRHSIIIIIIFINAFIYNIIIITITTFTITIRGGDAVRPNWA